jgi:hypothetical protein
MASRLNPLGDYNVCAIVDGSAGLIGRANCLHDRDPGGPRSRCQVPGIAPEEVDDLYPLIDAGREPFLLRPYHVEIYPEWSRGQ